MVPLTFHFGPDESYTDKVDMSNKEFYERLRDAEEFPTTAQPPVGAFVEAYESLSAYDNLLVLTISRKLSGTYDSASQAAEMVDRPVEVLDTRSAEMGAGLILLEALRCIDQGGEFAEVRRAAETAIGRCNIYFAVGTLEYLAKSGRIGRAQRLWVRRWTSGRC
jgi:DegV family protein with EDD domain